MLEQERNHSQLLQGSGLCVSSTGATLPLALAGSPGVSGGSSLLLHWLESRWAGHSITTRGHSCTTAGLLPGSQAQGKVGQAGRLGCLGSCCGGPGLPWEEPPLRRGVKMDPRLSDSEKTTPPYTAYLPGSAKRDQLGTAAISEIILPFAVGEGYPPTPCADRSPSRALDSMPVYISPLLIIFGEKRRAENSTGTSSWDGGHSDPHLQPGTWVLWTGPSETVLPQSPGPQFPLP